MALLNVWPVIGSQLHTVRRLRTFAVTCSRFGPRGRGRGHQTSARLAFPLHRFRRELMGCDLASGNSVFHLRVVLACSANLQVRVAGEPKGSHYIAVKNARTFNAGFEGAGTRLRNPRDVELASAAACST